MDFKALDGKAPLWTNSMFGGMPSYQIWVQYPYNVTTYVISCFKTVFPNPIDTVLLYLLGAYLLFSVLRVKPWLAAAGAIAFAFSSYNFIIIEAGHSNKALALAFFAPILAGILLTMRRQYLLGVAITAIALALEIRSNHIQMTYYLFIAILVFTYGIITKSFIRYLSFITGTILLILITLSNSRQGLISFGIGMGIVILIFTYLHSKKLGMLLSLAFMTISVLVIMAMLQFGPLVQYVYKNSVSIRGFYWRAGIEMLKSNLLTGVGVDSYGDYFRLVREKEYPLRYGFQIMSDNAHNVPIQIFATSGIFAGIAYLSLNIFIFICGVKALKKVSGKNKMAIAGIFGAWISFQAQSIISIDNVGVTIWGWLLGGVLVGLGLSQNFDDSIKNERINSRKNSTTIELKQKIFSSLLALVTFIGCSTLYQGEKLMYEIVSWVNLGPKSQPNEFYDAMNRFENAKLVEPAYKFRAANIWFQIGEVEKAEKSVLNLLEFDPNSYDYLNGCVQIYLNKSMWGPLISCSERIVEIDPFNAQNYLILAQAYTSNNQIEQAIQAYQTILTFAKDKPQGLQAETELRKLIQ
jgi:hypothetical protein